MGAGAHVQNGTECQKSRCKRRQVRFKEVFERKHAFEREMDSGNIRVPSVKKRTNFKDNVKLEDN